MIRVLALIEAATVTGPARNLLRFSHHAKAAESGGPAAEISIATFRRHELAPQDPFVEAARSAGVEVHILRERFRFDPQIISALKELLRRLSPDLVQSHGVKSHCLMRLCAYRRYPWIAFHHGYTAEDLKMKVYNQLDRWSLPAAQRVIAVCRPFAEDLARIGVQRERIQVLPNSIEPPANLNRADGLRLRQQLGIAGDERVILSIGRFSPEKAQIDLIPAIADLAGIQPDLDFRLLLVGDGPERQRVERAAAAAGLATRVLFPGHQRDVSPYYALADAFVLPSHSEGSPNVVLEAMAAGVPIVATAVGGVPETVANEESALLVPARDRKALALALHRLLTDRELSARLKRNAALAVQQRFVPERYRERLLAVYSSLCGEHATQAGSSNESISRA